MKAYILLYIFMGICLMALPILALGDTILVKSLICQMSGNDERCGMPWSYYFGIVTVEAGLFFIGFAFGNSYGNILIAKIVEEEHAINKAVGSIVSLKW